MLIEYDTTYKALCDVCGRFEMINATSHAEAWETAKRRAWIVRRKAFPVVHVCPECPAEGESK